MAYQGDVAPAVFEDPTRIKQLVAAGYRVLVMGRQLQTCEINEIAAEVAPVAATVANVAAQQRPRRRLKDPKPFSGKKSEWRSFRLEAENVLATDREAIGDARDQLRTVYSWLDGKPKNSSTSYVSASIQQGVADPSAFLNRLEAVYGERDRKQKALKALREIRQGDDETFAAFYPRFEAELNDAGSELWPEDTKINYLQGALNEALKSRLVMVDDTDMYFDFARQCEKISSKMELLGQWKSKNRSDGRKHRSGPDTSKRIISKNLFHSLKLPRIPIRPRYLKQAAKSSNKPIIDTITYMSIDIDGHQQERVFMYVVPNSSYDMILGKPWMKDNDVMLDTKNECLEFRRSGIKVWNKAKPSEAPAKQKITQVMASTFLALVRKNKREARQKGLDPLRMGVYSVSLADIDKALRPKQKGDPNKLLPSQYRDALESFSRELADKLPPNRAGVDHTIELEMDENGNEKPVPWGPLYGMSREELLVLRKTLTELLEKGFIRASNSPAAAPVLFVRKPGGGIRFCVDYRGLNHITRKDRYPLPLIGETIRSIAKAKWFTKLDVIAAFHRIRMAKGEEWKTAFRTRYGLFEWNVMPFGLTGAPAAFQRYLNDVLREYLDDFVSAYVDDILIYSSGSLKDHREKVKKVLQKVQEAGLQLDIDKCEFEVQTVKYLGFVVTAGKGIEVDPAKVEAIRSWETPTNVKGVRGFLGFANFYRTFIEAFSDKARPLTRLTGKGAEFYWGDDCEKAFLALKGALITAPVLVHFDENRETRVDADSSGYATGGVLLQLDDQDRWRPVAFFSQKHSPAEMNYKIYDKELLAIVRCLKAWRAELVMTQFKVMTDHKNLRYFYKEQELSERQIRWAEFLSQFNFTLEWRPGKESELPDQLSRRAQDMPKEGSDDRLKSRFRKLFQDVNLESVNIATGKTERAETVDVVAKKRDALDFEHEVPVFEDSEMQKAWTIGRRTDETYMEISRAVAAGNRSLPTKVAANTPVSISECSLDKRGLLHFRSRLWIPNIARHFFWPGITNEVRQFLSNCDTCKRTTIWRQSKQGLLKPLPIPERIWSEIHIDFITELPPTGRDNATNLMGITDRLTKGVILEALDDISAEAVARRLFSCYFPYHGIPTTITSDRGPQFVGDHPQTDGGQERMNQEIEKMLRAWVTYAQTNWGDLLPVVTTALNNRDATATGMSPFFFTHGYHMDPIQLKEDRPAATKPGQKIAEDFVARIQEASDWAQAAIAWAQDRQERAANKHKKAAPNYKVGDWVFLDLRNVKTARPSKKLDWLHAKYRVVEQKSSHSYKLDVPGRIHPVFHVDLLRPASANPLPSQKIEDLRKGPMLVDGHEEWLVERILDEKVVGRGKNRLERARMTSALGGGAACCLDIAMCNWESIINSIKNTEMDADRSTPPQSSATPSSSSVLPSDSVSQVASTPSDSEAPSARRTVKRRKLRATSTWDHFREAEGDEPHAMSGNVLHYCKRCRNPSWSTHISGNARYHLEKSHHIVVQESSTSQDKRQLAIENAFARTTVKRAQDVRKNELNTLRSAINVDAFREAQMLLSARRHLPLSFATWPEYQALLAAVNPAVQELLTESASTVASDLDRAYEAHQESVRRQLGRARSLVHIAMDVWSSPQRKAYIAVHAQWVDEGYSPRKALLGLPNLRRSHAGAAMAPYLMRIIRRYSLAHRIGYFTGDNDTKNDTCLRQLAVDLSQEYGISFDPVSSRTRCAGHIINLSLQAFLFATSEEALQAAMEQAQDEASDVTVADALHDQVHSSTRQTTHGKRKKRNDTAGWRSIGPLGKLHNIAVFIRNSTVRNDAWDDIAGKALGIDNITRWNSWYKLLDAAISQEGPLSILLNQFHNELEADILTHDDWQVLKMTHEFLQPFHQATLEQQMEWASIDQVLENMDILFMQFEDAKVKYADNARMVNSVHMGWWVLAKYYAESDKNPVYATALLLHPEKRRRYLDRHWPEEWRQTAINGARRLWAKYKDRPLASESASRLRNERGEATPYERIKQSMSVLDKTDDEDELEKFVESAPRHTTTKTPLEWWCRDEQRMEYPRLHQMALDIFSVPAMSDDPERVFSCARRTISWDRARLSADTIEELQCLGNWVKNDLIRKLYVAVDDEIIDVAGADDESADPPVLY
ncbi:hypothetical protein O9K51_11425 [Purpureocillium lavendulum]|uniref:Reverse transcriptase n=3 Tax=Purpureocillium lavendulum TaxID=1247861 RepID=A0AB34FCA0_9HYPO|nr:hypothetical protein O9K51_11425 [Purpureocillium lavendulum]